MSYHRPYDPYPPPGHPHHHHHPPPPPPDYPPPLPPLPPPPPPDYPPPPPPLPPPPPPGYQGYFYNGPPPPPPPRQQQNNQDDSGCISFLKGWYDVSSLRSLYYPLIFPFQHVFSASVHFISPARNAKFEHLSIFDMLIAFRRNSHGSIKI